MGFEHVLMFIQDIEAVLQNWKDHITSSHYIFYFAPKGAPRSMLIFEGSPVSVKDPRLRKIPFPIQRPTFVETKHVQQALSTVEFFRISETEQIVSSTIASEVSKGVESIFLQEPKPVPKTAATRQEDPIYAPIKAGNLDEVKRLLESDANYSLLVPENPEEVMTPIFAACLSTNFEIVQYLL